MYWLYKSTFNTLYCSLQIPKMKITISLGSNTEQQQHIKEAIERLKTMFSDITFTQPQWTEPVGVVSDRYLNCLANFTTSLSLQQLVQQLKDIETAMGDTHENHKQGIVLIDLDVIKYGDKEVKKIAWLQ
ncbi:2-amino-4-hydroxy-6-hydroxymethyldihydropteridinediphosphokinase [Prevotella intermedia]|nr:2-amino-4-hydroxy-6-hydroxymethyldihydropteridinediphosphokinase [Prevotella intermedia]